MNRKLLFVISALILSGCSSPEVEESGATTVEKTGCPDAIIDWMDVLKLNDIKYTSLDPGSNTVAEEDIGDALAEVTYMMDENACSDHQMRNGDAAYLEVGTEIHEINGYESSFRVIADGKVYEVF